MRFYTYLLCTVLMAFAGQVCGQTYTVKSPNGLLTATIGVDPVITYAVSYDGTPLITPSAVSVTLDNGLVLGDGGTVQSTETRSVDEPITRVYGKNDITDTFNELVIHFTESYSFIVRAYDEGVAYRFVTALAGNVIVVSEGADFNFAVSPGVIFPEADAAMQSWERAYTTYDRLTDIPMNRFAITPTLFSFTAADLRVVIAESDLLDYPGMYLERNAGSGVRGKWAQYPKAVSDPTDIYKYHRVTERENYLARTTGTRSYPWRVVIVSADDKNLLTNELIFKLASPQVLTNTSWIKPGKSAWEWWHDAILETTLIPSGTANLGLPLYKFYIDFAAENKLEYITMDAGWSTDYATQVCQYAATKNVKVFVWDFINLPVADPNRLTQLKNIGAVGVKVDLIERDDQVAINWLEQLAKDCADRGLMIAFHGCPKPTGLQRKYPNIINYEAVRGNETTKWDDTANPDYHLQVPFIRMLAGPLDYTPGSMRNVHRAQFKPVPAGIPMTMGTRIHELAMYVMFDQPLGYLCDSPTEYRKYSDLLGFLGNVPTEWDKSVPLAARVGEYAAFARKSGEEWYVGAMTNHEARDIEIDFSFLPPGVKRLAEIYHDTQLSDGNAKVYTQQLASVTNGSKLSFHMVAEGGLIIRVHSDEVTGTEGATGRDGNVWVYANEDHTQLSVRSDEGIRQVRILDMSGRSFFAADVAGRSTLEVVDTSMLAHGLYVARVTTASGVYTIKFVK